MSSFNPYREWLSIDCEDGSPSYYELLGLEPTIEDAQQIRRAAERAKSLVRGQRPGAHAVEWARVLDEIEEARQCLSNPARRARYDLRLASASNETTVFDPSALQPDVAEKDVAEKATDAGPAGLSADEDFGLDGDVDFGALAKPVTAAGGDSESLAAPPSPVATVERPVANAPHEASAMGPRTFHSHPAPAGTETATADEHAGSSGEPSPTSSQQPEAAREVGMRAPLPAVPNSTARPDVDPMAPIGPNELPDPMAPHDPLASPDPMAPVQPGAPADVLFGPVDDGSSPIPAMLPPGVGDEEEMGPVPGAGAWGPDAAAASDTLYPSHPAGAAQEAPVGAAPSSAFVEEEPPVPRVGKARSASTRVASRSRSGCLTPLLFAFSGCLLGGIGYVLYQQYGPPSAAHSTVMAGPNAGMSTQLGDAFTGAAGGPSDAAWDGTTNGTERGDDVDNGFDTAMQSGFGRDRGAGMDGAFDDRRSADGPMGEISAGPTMSMPMDGMPMDGMSVGAPTTDTPTSGTPAPEPPTTNPTTPSTTTAPTTTPPTTTPSSEPTAEQLAQLELELVAVAVALRARDYARAEEHLAVANKLPLREEDVTRLGRWMTAVEYARGFRQAILDGTAKLQATDVLTENGVSVAVVETARDYIILRVRGQNRRYELDDLPPGLAVILAHQAIAPDDPATILSKAIYVAFDPKADAEALGKARDWIAEAATRLPAAKGMEMVLAASTPAETSAKPATTTLAKGDDKLTPAQRQQLSAALKVARKAVEEGDFDRADQRIEEAEKLATIEPYRQLVWRLKTLSEQARAFTQAIQEGIASLKTGEIIQVGTSTELEVVRTTDKTLVVKIPGIPAPKVYQNSDLPLGLAMALGLRALPADEPQTKALQASYVVATATGNEPAIEKARAWYSEAAFGDSAMAGLSEVIADDYEFAE